MRTLVDEMVKQSQNLEHGNFLCTLCKNYDDNLRCKKGVFIAFEGANLSHCTKYEAGKRCAHCGKIT